MHTWWLLGTILLQCCCIISLDASQRPHHLCLLVYRFPPSFVPRLSSHGNSKEKQPFFPTWPSTHDLIKKQYLKQGPKETVERVSSEVGGVVEAAGPGQLPRSEKQVTNIRRTEKLKHGYTSDAANDLFVIMQRAHTEDPSSQFIRGIRTAPDPAIVLTYDFQLKDVVHFCTSSTGEFCILIVRHSCLENSMLPQSLTVTSYWSRGEAIPIQYFWVQCLCITVKLLLHIYFLHPLWWDCHGNCKA